MRKKKFFIIGGGQIYEQAMPYINKVYLTEVDIEVKGEVTFPELPHRGMERNFCRGA